MERLIKGTTAYKIFCGDALSRRLSHAYMLYYPDALSLREALKIFAVRLFGFESGSRGEHLIWNESFADCKTYPAADKKLTVENAADILSDSALQPVEGDKKLYVIGDFSTASPVIQNKLLKVLEEPPTGVYFLLGVTNLSSVLDTVRSRVRTLEIPPFSAEEIFSALERLGSNPLNRRAAESCAGLFGDAREMVNGEIFALVSSAADEICSVASLSQAGEIAAKYGGFKEKNRLLTCIQLNYMRKLEENLRSGTDDGAISNRALVYALESVNAAFTDVRFNANFTALLYDLAVRVVTENEKWKKL